MLFLMHHAIPPKILLFFMLGAISISAQKSDVRAGLDSLVEAEREFSDAASAQGVFQAYLSYLAEGIRFMREGSVPIIGYAATKTFLSGNSELLTSKPIDAYVSRSDDLGYVYGKKEFRREANSGDRTESSVFVRIWKRNPHGLWKIVLDITNPLPSSDR